MAAELLLERASDRAKGRREECRAVQETRQGVGLEVMGSGPTCFFGYLKPNGAQKGKLANHSKLHMEHARFLTF